MSKNTKHKNDKNMAFLDLPAGDPLQGAPMPQVAKDTKPVIGKRKVDKKNIKAFHLLDLPAGIPLHGSSSPGRSGGLRGTARYASIADRQGDIVPVVWPHQRLRPAAPDYSDESLLLKPNPNVEAEVPTRSVDQDRDNYAELLSAREEEVDESDWVFVHRSNEGRARKPSINIRRKTRRGFQDDESFVFVERRDAIPKPVCSTDGCRRDDRGVYGCTVL